MARARIRVDLPDGAWKADVSEAFPGTDVRLQSAVVRGDVGVEVVALSGECVGDCAASIRDHPAVAESTVVQRADCGVTLQVESSDPVLLSAAHESETPLSYPIDVHGGEAVVDVVSTHGTVSAFGEQLHGAGLDFDVGYVQPDHETRQVLTDRQQEVVLSAAEHGYYETPRQCSLTELADELGVAKSTCSGTLQRAEAALVEHFFDVGSPPSRHFWTDGLVSPEQTSG